MKIYFRGHNFRYNLEHVVRIFFNDVSFAPNVMTKKDRSKKEDFTYFRYLENSSSKKIFVVVSYNKTVKAVTKRLSDTATNNEVTRAFAVTFYDIMTSLSGYYPPWGVLTGVRPLKVVLNRIKNNKTKEEIEISLKEEYRVGEEKVSLAYEAALASNKIAEGNTLDSCSIYISIPFCPSRCNYCSFTSKSIEKEFFLVDEYIKKLVEEIAKTADIVSSLNLRIRSIYIGGGTPTVLSDENLLVLLTAINKYLNLDNLEEYTVEAGRPDTITKSNLLLLKEFDITRISINPQTFNDRILEKIGRRHTANDILNAFELAKIVGLNNINADLIAGLPLDTVESFQDSLEKLISLAPTAITVHTLTIKKSSNLIEEDEVFPLDVAQMIKNSYETLKKNKFFPYYLYRQKGTLENLENIGYSQRGFEGLYNVYIMDELHSIFSVGAGAVTKIVNQASGHIERLFNYKYPREYINNFPDVIKRKTDILSIYRK